MPVHALCRIDTRAASLMAVGIEAAIACSPGAPPSESRSYVPEFTTIPGVGWMPPNDISTSAGGSAAVGSGGDANGASEGNRAVSGLDRQPSSPLPSMNNQSSSSASGGAEVATGGAPSSDDAPPAESDPAAGEANSGTCALDVSVTTAPHGGRYSPRNVGAIWIADGAGSYVKSLDVWGNRRLTHVEAWNAATRAAGVPQDRVDAVTGATEATHRAHSVSWDCTDHQGQLVQDGSYRVYFEVTEANGAGPNHFETFEKGPTPTTLQASAPSFEGIVLSFQP